jgi:hypothetical protein
MYRGNGAATHTADKMAKMINDACDYFQDDSSNM